MLRILFIVPPHISAEDYLHPPANARHVRKKDGRSYGSLLTDMPLGILSLSAYAKRYATTPLHTQLCDFNLELNALDGFAFGSFPEFFSQSLEKIKEFSPHFVGISTLFTPSYHSMLEIAACCKSLWPATLVLAGGSIPSILYREIFQASNDFDGLCYGEGEKPLLGLLESADPHAFLQTHPSWITRRKIQEGAVFSHDFIEDLDEIPFYDYELCAMEKYSLNPATSAYGSIQDQTHNFHVMTSRGCPFKCTFCASHKVHGRSMRYYSPARVEADFTRLRDKYGARILVFQDDHFMGDRARALHIIHLVKRLGLQAVFQNGLTLYALDREMLEALQDAGADQLVLSVESGSDRVLKELMHKPLKLSIVLRVAQDCRELGIYTNVNILIGMPGETKKDIEDARQFLKTVPANWFMILCTSPLVGSEIHDVCTQKHYIKEGVIGTDFRTCVIETEDFSAEYIQETAYRLNLELNFVENSDFKLGQYAMAMHGFKNAIRAREDHALAHYYLGQCYEKLGDLAKAGEHTQRAYTLYQESSFWRQYFTLFQIPVPSL